MTRHAVSLRLLSLPYGGDTLPQLFALYGLYKQATVGPCNVKRPSFIDVVGRSKWCVCRAPPQPLVGVRTRLLVYPLPTLHKLVSMFPHHMQGLMERVGRYEFRRSEEQICHHSANGLPRLRCRKCTQATQQEASEESWAAVCPAKHPWKDVREPRTT